MRKLLQALDWAMGITGTPDDALHALAQRESAKRLAALGGSDPALEPIPRRQAVVSQEQGLVARTSEP